MSSARFRGSDQFNFEMTNKGGSNWCYDYTVQVQRGFLKNQGFTIYFAYDLYGSLALSGSQPGWDVINRREK